MPQPPRVESIAANSDSIGTRAARHLELAFRDIMREQGAMLGERYLCQVTGEPHPFGNLAVISDPGSEATTAAAVAPLLHLKVATMVLYTAGVSDGVAATLVGQGYARAAMPAMAVDIDRLPPSELPADYRWSRIGVGADGIEWCDVLAAGYDLPRGVARMLSPEALGADMAADAPIQFFGVRHGDRLVATSMLYLADGLAGIYCVATLAEERGKGLGAYVTAQALRIAHAVGYRVGVLQSSDQGHSVYLGIRFADVGWVPMFIRMPA